MWDAGGGASLLRVGDDTGRGTAAAEGVLERRRGGRGRGGGVWDEESNHLAPELVA